MKTKFTSNTVAMKTAKKLKDDKSAKKIKELSESLRSAIEIKERKLKAHTSSRNS